MKAAATYPLGLLGFSLVLAAYKALVLSFEMTGAMAVFLPLMSLDLSFLALLALSGVLHSRLGNFWARLPIKLLMAFSVAFYVVHSFVLLALDEPMSLFDLARYLPETAVVGSFFNVVTTSAILGFVIMALINIRLNARVLSWTAKLAAVMLVAGLLAESFSPVHLQKYGLLKLDAFAQQVVNQPVAGAYSPQQAGFYAASGLAPVEFIHPEPDIILLIVESLSSINSQRVSGERNLLSRFDELSENGVLFSNFIANHSASEGGLISLLSGFPPLHFPTATPLMFDEFALQPSVISEYRAQGYQTEFLTNTRLGFIGMDRYLSGLNFHLTRGRDEVPALAKAPRFVQDAPSDRFLYTEALDRVEGLSASGQPWLMTIATVSTHLPYSHPEGGEDTAVALWSWSLERLEEFYDGLEERGFFSNGILLITGDHRQMRPLTRQESTRYGDSAKARVPLLAIGPDLLRGAIDERFFQQSDLLRYLNRISDAGQDLSPHPVWVERYNRIYGKVESINRFSVFDEANLGMREYPVQVNGSELEWSAEKPAFSRAIEARVHAQRSAHQLRRNGESKGCLRVQGDGDWLASKREGLLMTKISGASLNDLQFSSRPGVEVAGLAEPVTPGATQAGAGQLNRFRSYLEVEIPGTYWFRFAPGSRACLEIDRQMVLDQFQPGLGVQGSIKLSAGFHQLDLRIEQNGQLVQPPLQWVTPGLVRWKWKDIPAGQFRIPLMQSGQTSNQ